MNSLYYFWNEYPLKEAAKKWDEFIKTHPEVDPKKASIPINNKLSSAQADMFEGTVGFEMSEILQMDFGEHLLSDAIFRAIGFQYCNTLCFYRLDYGFDGFIVSYNEPNMKCFGEYVAIIKDKEELIRRINSAAVREKIDYLCGDVHYRRLRFEGKNIDLDQNHVLLKCGDVFDITDYNLKAKRDCFVKMDKYSWQKEWRVALYRGVKETEAYRLEIGDIRDIVEGINASDLNDKVGDLFKAREIKLSESGYFGNISRKDLKEKYYNLGDNKAEMFCFIG